MCVLNLKMYIINEQHGRVYMKKYIMMRGDNKVSIKSDIDNHITLCGGLTFIDKFEPLLYKRNIRNRIKAYTYGLEMVQVHTEDFIPENLPKNVYAWLLAECDGTVYKVWGEGTMGNVKNYVRPAIDGLLVERVVTTVNGDYIASELKLFNF